MVKITRDILVKLTEIINCGWSDMYSAELQDGEAGFNIPFNKIKDSVMVVRMDESKIRNPEFFRVVTVALHGPMTATPSEVILDEDNLELIITVVDNKGEVHGENALAIADTLVKERLAMLTECRPFLDTIDKLIPLNWMPAKSLDRSGDFAMFTVTGYGLLLQNGPELSSYDDLDEFAKIFLGATQLMESPMCGDQYLAIAKMGIVNDCFRKLADPV